MPDQMRRGLQPIPFSTFHRECIACEYRSSVNTGQEWCWIWRDGASPKSSLPLWPLRLRSRRPSAHKFRTQRAAASTRGIWHCRRSLCVSCGLKLSGRCIPHFGKRRRLTIRPITTAATRRREFAYPDDKPEPNRLWRPRVKVKDALVLTFLANLRVVGYEP